MEFCIEQSNKPANPFVQNPVFLFQTNLLNLLPLPKDIFRAGEIGLKQLKIITAAAMPTIWKKSIGRIKLSKAGIKI